MVIPMEGHANFNFKVLKLKLQTPIAVHKYLRIISNFSNNFAMGSAIYYPNSRQPLTLLIGNKAPLTYTVSAKDTLGFPSGHCRKHTVVPDLTINTGLN